ncbi:uncharacterized protein LOC123564984 isoform X2 [Mercenaria mercenaria]|uniref:uncharacterized protein LOC123564984 isoform X2 n=1 Tax=Mercenaria mercenaria TaxID=6596 RepID=UPI00234F91DC|nr:uncharacterized protein LOC123564984 isoform X2 [Mercenaria mercenaria]
MYTGNDFDKETIMHGWERLSNLCGMGCKVLWTSWSHDDKAYDSVNKDDTEALDAQEPVTSEPQKPIWSDIKAPIVRNKSGSVGNIKTGSSTGYERLSANGLRQSASLAKLNEKRNSKSDLSGSVPVLSKTLLKEEKSLNSSRTSLAEEVLEVHELVTTV